MQVLCAVMLIWSGGLFDRADSKPRLAQRVIKQVEIFGNEPVAITDIQVGEQRISFGKPFKADEEWLQKLEFSVKNTSSQRILYLALEITIPRPPKSDDPPAMNDMYALGNRALEFRTPTTEERSRGLERDETVKVKLSPTARADLLRFLLATRSPKSITHVELRIGEVIFEDDTMWYLGSPFRRDKDPSKWKRS